MEYMRKKREGAYFFFLFGLKQAKKKICSRVFRSPPIQNSSSIPLLLKKKQMSKHYYVASFSLIFLFLLIKVSLEPQFLLHIVHRCFPCQWSYSQCPVLILYFVYAMLCTYATVCHSEYCREGRFVMRFSRFLKTRMM